MSRVGRKITERSIDYYMKKKIISLILALTMAIPLAFPTTASQAPDNTNLGCEPSTGSSLSVNKYVTYDNTSGKYTVNLEAYDPGKATENPVPSKTILVLDESNSMTADLNGNYFENDYSADYLTNSEWYSKSNIYFCPEGSQEYCKISVSSETEWDWFHTYFSYTYTFKYKNSEKSFTSNHYDTRLNLLDEIKARFNLRGEIVVGSRYQSKEKILKDKTKQLLEELRTAAKNKKLPCNVALVAFSNTNESCIFTGYGERRMLNNLSFGDGDHTYKNCFIDITDDNKYKTALDCVYSLKPHGNSDTFAGITLAEKILDLTKPAYNQGQSTGNKSVIFMSDGGPSINGEAFTESYASNAIKFTQHWENCTVGGREISHPEFLDTKTFSLSIFNKSNYSTVLPKYKDCGNLINCQNRFLNLLSSDYPNAMDFKTTSPDTTEKTSGYYYNSEANFNELIAKIKERAFATETVETAATSLDASSSVKDFVSQYFKLPDGFKASDVSVKTVNCIGNGSDGKPKFAASCETLSNANVSFDTSNNSVSVSGFSFKDNYCSMSARDGGFYGKKLVVSFNITPKDDFLGGNNVPTNDYFLNSNGVVTENNKSGVYSGGVLVKPFSIPTADVAIKSKEFDKTVNVYAGNPDPVFTDAFTLPTAGQNSWVDDYVISSTSTNVTGGATVADDKTIETVLTLEPKNQPSNIGPKVLPGALNYTMNVFVFKPTIPCADKTIYLGEEIKSFIPDNITTDKAKIEWYHNTSKASASTMLGTEPALSYAFDTPVGYFERSTPVNVTSVINKNTGKDIFAATSFVNPGVSQNSSEFTIYVKTCKLTVTKSFENNKQYNDSNESFIFNIKGDEVNNPLAKKVDINVVVTKDKLSKVISGLPIGKYTVTEESGWSWRYTAAPVTADITAAKPNGAVTITNKLDDNEWLNGFAKASNIFNKQNGEAGK